LLGCTTLEPVAAINCVERWLTWLMERADVPINASLVAPAQLGAEIETLYFDGPREEDWIALFRIGVDHFPALDGNHIFVPKG